MWATLQSRKDGLVDFAREFFFAKHHPTTWTTHRLMSGCRHYVESEIEGVAHRLTRNQPTKVRRISHRERSNLISNCLEFLVVDITRVRGITAKYHLGLVLKRVFSYLVVIDGTINRISDITHKIEELTHVRNWCAMCQVTTVG